MENATPTAPPVEGSPEGTGSQTAEKVGKPDIQSQDTGQPQVEGTNGQQTSSQTPARPAGFPSYYRRERKRLDRLEEQNRQLTEQLQKLTQQKQTADEPKPITDDQLSSLIVENPKEAIALLRKQIQSETDQKTKDLKREIIESIKAEESAKQFDSLQQEALELLYPKDSSKPEEGLEVRILSNPERHEKIMQILDRYGLSELSKTHPKQAAEAVLEILNKSDKPKGIPNPTKGQMGTTATGQPTGGGFKKAMTLPEIKEQVRKLEAQLEDNPDLRYDDKWKAARESLKEELTKRAKELQTAEQ